MNVTNPIEICQDLFVLCNQTFSNHTACSATEKALEAAPAIIQKSVCWTGNLGYALGDNWFSVFNKIDYYGGCLEFVGINGVGIIGRAAWVLLTAAVVKAVYDRATESRNKVVSEKGIDFAELLNKGG